MHSFTEFLNMGGYAGYVWPAYLITTLILAVMVAATVKPYSRVQKNLDKAQHRDHEA